MLITTLRHFILLCASHDDPDAIYTLFEHHCSDAVRAQVYKLADPTSPEPFRSAMHNIGFTNY